MNSVIVVFNSRNETLYFAQSLKNQGILCQIINTPKEAGPACGISVKISQNILEIAKNILMNKPFRTFVGIFKMLISGGRTSLEKLY